MSDLISIIVPVYNEGATIGELISRLLAVQFPAPCEIIVVNDGSQDSTKSVLDALNGTNPSLTIIHSERNRGKGAAVRTGLARSRGTVAAIQDADLELDPAELAGLVEPVLKGETVVVYGSRFLTGSSPVSPVTRFANSLLTGLTNLLFGSSLTDMETCYKVIRGDVARQLHLAADGFDIEPEITARLLLEGYHILERPVRFTPRSRAAGKKIRWRDGVHAIGTLVRHRFKRTPRS